MDKALEQQIQHYMGGRLAEGADLSVIQNEVNEKFQLHLTYMDIRILASTLPVDWKALDPNAARKEAEEKKRAEEEAAKKAAAEAESDNAMPETESSAAADAAQAAGGATVVEVSKLARPGMMLCGTVKFASGSTAEWYIDNTGRLGLDNLVGEKPNQQDIEQFQVELDKAVRKVMGR